MPGRSASSRPDPAGEAGVTLMELLIALGILSAVLIALGGLMFQVARHTRNSAAVGYRSAAAVTAAAWAQRVPWDSIDAAVGCAADSTGRFTYTRCTTATSPTPRSKQVTVVISATGPLAASPETVIVYRSKPRSPSPFKVN